MLFKLTISNIRKSLRDYAIYFFTLIIGVSVFYLFNAIDSQTAYLTVSEDTRETIRLVDQILSGVSVFVAVVLGLLIVYASRFLMKRRNREFALYLTLGMSKGGISLILLTETVLIGAGSLFIGLLIGIGLSQVTSSLVAGLFEADMTKYHFNVSSGAIFKTLVYFGIMYIVVMLFNTVMIGRRKLIDLINSGKRNENRRVKNPIVCVIIFVIAAAMLGFAYYQVGWKTEKLEEKTILLYIAMGCVSTFLIFWSVSGLLLRIFMSAKKVYFRGLNSFTFRQLSSKVNTMVFSMTLICLMLFVTICSLCGAFTIRNSLNKTLEECCPADYQARGGIYATSEISEEGDILLEYKELDLVSLYENAGIKLDDYFTAYAQTRIIFDSQYNSEEYFGEYLDKIHEEHPILTFQGSGEPIVSLSDYNSLMEVFGREKLTLKDDEYIVICDFEQEKAIRDYPLARGHNITVFGNQLKPKYDHCIDGVVELSSAHENIGVTIVPDSVAAKKRGGVYFLTGNFKTDDKEEIRNYLNEIDKLPEIMSAEYEKYSDEEKSGYHYSANAKLLLAEANIGMKALVTFLGLYLGIVFLITSGAILALRSLSDSSDSVGRYDMLRKIGADEGDITHSLFLQTFLFFALPLALAIIHSVFGMKFAYFFLNLFGTTNILPSMLITGGIILLIFGGYFAITYFCSKLMIKQSA